MSEYQQLGAEQQEPEQARLRRPVLPVVALGSLLAALVATAVLAGPARPPAGPRATSPSTAASLLGGDADEHGCRASAGYQWCEAKSSCIRPWEHGLHTRGAVATACFAPAPVALLGGDADEHGCRASAGYSWCEATSTCLRPWEHGLDTPEAFAAKCTPPARAATVAAAAPMLGAGRDEYDCIPSAGYSWCPALKSCIRPWEQKLRTPEAFVARCQPTARAAPRAPAAAVAAAGATDVPRTLLGGDRDEHGCIPSAGYRWCEARSACIRPWEHSIHSKADFEAACSAAAGAPILP